MENQIPNQPAPSQAPNLLIPSSPTLNQNPLPTSPPPIEPELKKSFQVSKVVIIGIVIVILLAVFAGAYLLLSKSKMVESVPTPTPKIAEVWKTFADNVQGYTLQYPSSYEQTNVGNALFLEKDTITFSIHIDYPINYGIDSPSKIEDVEIDGIKAKKNIYLTRENKISITSYILQYGDKEFNIGYIKRTEDAKYLGLTDDELSTLERMVSSIKFTQ